MSRFYEQTFDPDPDAFVRGILGEVDRIAKSAQLKAIDLAKERGKKASGDFINSITREVERNASKILAEIGPTVSYGPFVEEDTEPHWAPIDPFKKWAREKFGAVGREKDSIAYAARWKVAQEGTRGAYVLRDALLFIEPLIARRIAASAVQNL